MASNDVWKDGLLLLIGTYVANLSQMQETLQEVMAELEKLRHSSVVVDDTDKGLGYPGTTSYEDGPEQYEGKAPDAVSAKKR